MAIKAKQVIIEKIIQLEMGEREARILQELVQNTKYKTLEEEPQESKNLRHNLFYAIKDVLDGDDK